MCQAMKRPDFMDDRACRKRKRRRRAAKSRSARSWRSATPIVAQAGNRTRELNDPTAHAEMLAIRDAAAALSAERLASADLYVTLEPCTMCAAAISFARIRRLYFGATDEKGGAVVSGVRFFASPTCHHVPEVYPGHRRNALGRNCCAASSGSGAASDREQSPWIRTG